MSLQRLGGHPGVLGQRPHRRVTGPRHEHRRAGAVLGVMGQRAMPQLVQRGASGGLGEQGGGLLIAEPGVAVLVEVGRRELDPGLAVGDEQRAGLAALQQTGQEPRGPGLPDDGVDGAALAADLGAAVGQVEVLDVQGEHLGRAGGGLVEHAPHGALAEADVLTGEQLLDVGAVQGAGAVRPRLAAPQHPRRVGGDPSLLLPVGRCGPDGVEGEVPPGRRAVAPLLAEPFSELPGVDVRGGSGAEAGGGLAENLAVDAAGACLLGAAQGGEVGVDGLAEGDVAGGRAEAVDGRCHATHVIRANDIFSLVTRIVSCGNAFPRRV